MDGKGSYTAIGLGDGDTILVESDLRTILPHLEKEWLNLTMLNGETILIRSSAITTIAETTEAAREEARTFDRDMNQYDKRFFSTRAPWETPE